MHDHGDRACGARPSQSLLLLLLLVLLTCCFGGFGCGAAAASQRGLSTSVQAPWEGTQLLAEALEFVADENQTLVWDLVLSLHRTHKWPKDTSDSSKCWQTILKEISAVLPPAAAKLLPLALSTRHYSARVEAYRQMRDAAGMPEDACCAVDINGSVTVTTPDEIKGKHAQGMAPLLAARMVSLDNSHPIHLMEADIIYQTSVDPKAGKSLQDNVVMMRTSQAVQRPGLLTVVLYGPPGARCTAELHAELRKRADQGGSYAMRYVYRPVGPRAGGGGCASALNACTSLGDGGPLYLPGYGVEAVLKNTEYSAMDDKNTGGPTNAEAGGVSGTGGIGAGEKLGSAGGFDFDVLVARKPSLAQELITLRDRLVSADEDEALKVWDLKDLGLQAAQRVASADDPLALLAEISQNFPALVTSLSRQPVNDSLRAAVLHNQKMISHGSNFMLINGLAFDVSAFNLYTLLDRLRVESRLFHKLTSMGLPASAASRVLSTRTEGFDSTGLPELRLDLGSAAVAHGAKPSAGVLWFNDLEKDAMYSEYGSSVEELLGTMPGRLRPLGLNAFSVVLVADPLHPTAAALAPLYYEMYASHYPIRMGLSMAIPAVLRRAAKAAAAATAQPKAARRASSGDDDAEDDDEASAAVLWSGMCASEKAARALLMMRSVFGPQMAFSLWVTISKSEIDPSDERWEESLLKPALIDNWRLASEDPGSSKRAKIAAKKAPDDAWQMLVDGAVYAAEAGMELLEGSDWLLSKGLAPSDEPLVWFNGKVSPAHHPNEDGGKTLMYSLVMEQQLIMERTYYGQITNAASVLEQMLHLTPLVVKQYNPSLVAALGGSSGGDADGDDNSGKVATATAKIMPLTSIVDILKPAPSFQVSTAAVVPVTLHVIVNAAEEQGRRLLIEALTFLLELKAGESARIVYLVNPPSNATGATNLDALLYALHAYTERPDAPANASATAARIALDILIAHRDATDSSFIWEHLVKGQMVLKPPVLLFRKFVEVSESYGFTDFRTTWNKINQAMGVSASDLRRSRDRVGAKAVPALLGLHLKAIQGRSAVVANGRLVRLSTPASILEREHVKRTGGAAGGSLEKFAERVESGIERLLNGTLRRGYAGIMQIRKDHANAQADAKANGGVVAPRPPPEEHPSRKKAWQSDVVWDGPTVSELSADDLQLLVSLAAPQGSAIAAALLSGDDAGKEVGAKRAGGTVPLRDVAAAAAAELSATVYPKDRLPAGVSKQLAQVIGQLKGQSVRVRGDGGKGGDTGIDIAVILNPLSRAAQQLSQVLALLQSSLGASVRLYLNPETDLQDLPLKSFYRYALPEVDPTGPGPKRPDVTLSRLPTKRVLTVNMDVPEAWLVELTQSAYDLDNLRLSDVPDAVVTADYGLSALVLSGSCVEAGNGMAARQAATRGSQLTLSREIAGADGGGESDTIVMANMAYFQLKAGPGSWKLGLAPGRTSDIYSLREVTAVDGSGGATTMPVIVSSFAGTDIMLKVYRRPGMEGQEILKAAVTEGAAPDEDEDDDYEGDEGGSGGGGGGPLIPAGEGAGTVHVFTIASGHMYERLQKIMILSVVKNTKARVKFWIIRNYVSPQHRRVIPEMAKEFGFDYEFVTYKWPHWLHKQTEKQRIIWAYKILFLDVLFPLDVERIIFVDSDQVVRADLAELYNMDIGGAPYAYTPLCDGNDEMDEFRFWKGGFWASHLQGKPYHISALYLVDLHRFRALAAGDYLRVIYDRLSKDPNSLANLDQDLPNYVQHTLPIYSLPQEWLWCESWCGNATKPSAKTIDLCNNPKTKEPKLTAARRIIAEWEGLDAEQAAATARIEAGGPPAAADGEGMCAGGTSGSTDECGAKDEL